MKNKVTRMVGGVAACIFVTLMITSVAFAANVTVTFITPGRVTQKVVPQGTNMTYQGPKDINFDGYAFCGWNVALANVQTDLTAIGVYMPIGSESQMVEAYTVYKNLPTGVLSYTNGTLEAIPEATRVLKTTPTPMSTPCKLTAVETCAMNPVGIPGKTCVVKWYNGSTGELCWADVVWYGTTMPDPADPCIDGYEFVGWYGSWTNITEDRDIMACYYKGRRVFYYDENGKSLGDQWIRMDTDDAEEVYSKIRQSGKNYLHSDDINRWFSTNENNRDTSIAAINY